MGYSDIRLLDGTTIIWPVEELIVTCPLLQNCGVRAKFGTAGVCFEPNHPFHFLYKFLARSLNFLFAGKFNNRGLRL
jgi:hypothetical protein